MPPGINPKYHYGCEHCGHIHTDGDCGSVDAAGDTCDCSNYDPDPWQLRGLKKKKKKKKAKARAKKVAPKVEPPPQHDDNLYEREV